MHCRVSPTKIPVYIALLVALALVCAPQAAVLATEATVGPGSDSTGPMWIPYLLRTPLGRGESVLAAPYGFRIGRTYSLLGDQAHFESP
jgi:hypothetical protein